MSTNNITLAEAFESVAIKLEGSGLTPQAFEQVTDATSYIGTKLKVNPAQAFILAAMLHNVGQTMETKEFADFAKVSPIRMMALQKDFDYLVNKGLIVCVKSTTYNYWQQTYTLSAGIIQATKYNKKYTPANYKDMSAQDILDIMESLLHDCEYNKMSYTKLEEYLEKLINDTQHLEFCKKSKEQGIRHADLVLFLIGVVCLVSKNEDLVTTSDYDEIIPSICQKQIIRQFKDKQNLLCVNNLMEATDNDFDTYRLTKKAKSEYLKDFCIEDEEDNFDEIKDSPATDSEHCDSPIDDNKESIVEKKLFYNPTEMQLIERLKDLLSQDKFEEVQNRMRATGIRPGFACLFYGSPGTGKTETVMQLARATGREIIWVNVSGLRNMYVGESEKNTQQIFDDYKEKLEKSDVAPILLFNEADAIFGNRYTGVNDSVDQMQNTIQNILLQNMERFEGILIATTNLTSNIDKAFDRRFLYKVEFKRPSSEVRQQIWMSIIPELSVQEADFLAKHYDFCGSQIENIAKRMTIDNILYNRQMSLDSIESICKEELINRPNVHKNWIPT